MAANHRVSLNLQVGTVSTEQSYLKIKIGNNEAEASALRAQIQGSTGQEPDGTTAWVFTRVAEDQVKPLLQEVGVNIEQTYPEGEGWWYPVDLSALPLPVPILEMPFVQAPLEGNAFIEAHVILESDTVKSRGPEARWIENWAPFKDGGHVAFNVDASNDFVTTFLSLVEELGVVPPDLLNNVRPLLGKFEELEATLKFGEWSEIPRVAELVQQVTEKINENGEAPGDPGLEIAKSLAREARLVIVFNEKLYLSVDLRVPNLVFLQ